MPPENPFPAPSGQRATRTRYACTDDGARGARIAAEDW